MNQGENSSFPNNPNFSNPNFSSDAMSDLGAANDSMPHAITSSDIAATAGTEAGVVAAAAAMPENDARQAISSASTSTGASSRSRFNFGSRRYNSNSTPTAQPSPIFAGAPDYFNQAAGDIVLEGDKPERGNGVKKRIVVILGIVAVIGALIFTLVFIAKPSSKKDSLEIAEKIFNSEDVGKIARMETLYRHVISGEARSDDVINEEGRNKIETGVDAYKRVYDELSKNKDSVKEAVKDIDVDSILGSMGANVKIYDNAKESFMAIFNSLLNGDDGYKDKLEGNNGAVAESYVRAYREYQQNATEKKKQKNQSGCTKTDRATGETSNVCDVYDRNMKKNQAIMEASTLAVNILIGDNEKNISDGFVSDALSKIYTSLKEDKQQKDATNNEKNN